MSPYFLVGGVGTRACPLAATHPALDVALQFVFTLSVGFGLSTEWNLLHVSLSEVS